MQKKFLPLFSFLLFLASSCSTDFDIASDWKEITVIYGLLNAGDTAQYVRVNKAFLSENTSALEIAPIADSLYHNPPAQVLLKRIDANDNVLQTITMQRVNAETEGILKDNGLFATNPYYLFKTNATLNPDFKYRIEVTTPENKVITAETDVIANFDAIRPDPEFDISLLSENYTMRWSPSDEVGIYDMDLYLRFDEQYITPTGSIVTEPRTIKWNVFSNLNRETSIETGKVTYDLNIDAFFAFLNQNLSDVDSVEYRYFKGIDFMIHAGSNELKTYNDVAFAQFGVTASQILLEYTNINGGLGLFASRYSKQILNVKLSNQSQDLLACDPRTKALKFASSPGNPAYPDCN